MEIGSQEWSDLIIEGAAAFDVVLNRVHTRQFALHAAELMRWNQIFNITAITDPREIAVKHFLDSVLISQYIPPATTMLDIGSGGGFPGLPLKVLLPSLQVTLIDASRKKVNFLKHVIRTLKLDNVEALHIRAEELAGDPHHRKSYQIIASRALTALNRFYSLAMPLLAAEGVILALKGDVENSEINELQSRRFTNGDDAPRGGHQISVFVEKFNFPILNSHRSVVIINPHKKI